jgi:hypothetical protein
VVLALGAMAYDVGLRALPPHRPTSLPDGSEVLLGLGECGPPRAYPARGLTLASWAAIMLCPAQLVPGARDPRLDDAGLDLGETR